jgi:hypothetical protein
MLVYKMDKVVLQNEQGSVMICSKVKKWTMSGYKIDEGRLWYMVGLQSEQG